jgi:outer membrane protein assembly factor BamB
LQRDQSNRPLANVALLILAIVAAAVAAAFVLPWFTWSRPGGELLARYSPIAQGGARLVVEYDATGTIAAWSSQNETLVPPGLALAAETRKAERDAVQSFFRRAGEQQLETDELIARMRGATVYRATSRRLAADGKLTDSTTLAIRNNDADYLVAIYDPASDTDTIFDPPIPILAANLTPGHSWRATGHRRSGGSSVEYQYSARVIEQEIADTLKVEARLSFTSGGETLYERVMNHTLAPGLGVVETRTTDTAGQLQTRHVLARAEERHLLNSAVAQQVNGASPAADVAKWQLTRFASTRGATDTSESSIPPTSIPTDPPLLLAARYAGPLTAFNTSEPGAPVAWRFHTGATIYGAPAFDAQRGRIFFGSADKRLYALDARGLFLWSAATGDNVVTRPVIAGNAVIFGSEDRTIRALDVDTGAELWRHNVGGPVVSSPVLVNGRAIFGCDDGGVYALDAASGERAWRFDAGAPVEAAIVAVEGRVFAATHEGKLIAIEPESGTEIWSATIGGALRTPPVIAGDRLYIVNGSGRLGAHELANGRRVWSSDAEDYVGPAAVVGETLIVGSTNGDVQAVSFSGQRVKTWQAANATSPSDGPPALRLGGSTGGGAVWFADSRSVIRRLGAEVAGPVALRASWLLPFSSDQLAGNFLTVTPVEYQQQALVVDGERQLTLLNPATGKGQRLGSFGDAKSVTVDPVVNGDNLLVIAGTALHAVRLPGAELLWKYDPGETGVQPPTVAGDTVLWLTQRFEEQRPIGTLHALDLRAGAIRWKQEKLAGFTGIGAAIVREETIFTTAPVAAWRLTSGEKLWELQNSSSPLGGGVLNPAGDLLFVGLIDHATNSGSIAAVRAGDGSLAWQRAVGESPLNPLERLALSGDVLVAPLWSGEVIGLSAASGDELWRYKPAKPRWGGITVAAGQVWLTESNARLVALDATTGRAVAQLALDIDVSNIQAFAPRPLAIGDHVVAPLGIALLGVGKPEAKQP